MTSHLLNFTFAVLFALTAGSALCVIFLRNILHAAVAFFFCLTGVAGLYVLLGADFLAATQLLIYAGGVVVLIIFGVFLTTRVYDVKLELSGRMIPKVWGFLLAAGVFVLQCLLISRTEWPTGAPVYEATTRPIGQLFLTKYLLPFEFISVVLLFAMIGAAVLVRKEMGGKPWSR